MSIDKWLKSGRYLPAPLRDFHDQKDTFKAIHEIISENQATKDINWIQAHCYVIDVFLWFMARRGYTLQRSRQRHDFLCLEDSVRNQKKKRDAAFMSALSSALPKDAP